MMKVSSMSRLASANSRSRSHKSKNGSRMINNQAIEGTLHLTSPVNTATHIDGGTITQFHSTLTRQQEASALATKQANPFTIMPTHT